MLESTGKVASSFEANFGTVFKGGLDFDLVGASNHAINFWHRKAAFVIFDGFAFGADNFGIDKGSKSVDVFIVEVVTDDNDALIDTKLRGSHGGGKLVGVFLFPIE